MPYILSYLFWSHPFIFERLHGCFSAVMWGVWCVFINISNTIQGLVQKCSDMPFYLPLPYSENTIIGFDLLWFNVFCKKFIGWFLNKARSNMFILFLRPWLMIVNLIFLFNSSKIGKSDTLKILCSASQLHQNAVCKSPCYIFLWNFFLIKGFFSLCMYYYVRFLMGWITSHSFQKK